MLKIGHRGAKGYSAENTALSFQKAIDLGCNGIELDVQICKSGEVVVLHDTSIDRTTNGSGFVKDLTLQELKKYNIPTLEEVLDLVNNYFLVNIELKSNDCVEKVMKIVTDCIELKKWNIENLLISSFNWNNLIDVANSATKIRTAVLTDNSVENAVAFAQQINAFAINPYYKVLNQQNVLLMRQKGLKIFAWTVNEPADIKRMKKLKIDGIISDYPDRI